MNPYHAVFQTPEGPQPSGVESTPLRLSQGGSFADRLAHDAVLWNSTEPGRLYSFEGTRLLGISLINETVRDTFGHGVATSAMVHAIAPEAQIVMVKVAPDGCVPPRGCIIDPSVAAGMKWASEQPWIDVISVSINIPANAPTRTELGPEERMFVEASRHAADAGKLIVNSAGNSPSQTISSYLCGTPWTISAGGSESTQHGQAATSSFLVDVGANYTTYLPTHDSIDGYAWYGGTSLSAPVVAGVLAKVLGAVRHENVDAATDRATTYEQATINTTTIRDALNATAELWTATQWDPTHPVSNDTLLNAISPTLPIVARGIQGGWGFVDGSTAEKMLAVLHGAKPAEKPREVVESQTRYQQLRTAYWAGR